VIEEIVDKLQEHFGEDLRAQQTIAMGEEAGEFLKAARRYMGMARKTGTFEEMSEELADVIITAYVTAEIFQIDLSSEVDNKLEVILSRGWKEPR
jgi:NTP pyrophosphatase (non-canonical NTP hydrolase)